MKTALENRAFTTVGGKVVNADSGEVMDLCAQLAGSRSEGSPRFGGSLLRESLFVRVGRRGAGPRGRYAPQCLPMWAAFRGLRGFANIRNPGVTS